MMFCNFRWHVTFEFLWLFDGNRNGCRWFYNWYYKWQEYCCRFYLESNRQTHAQCDDEMENLFVFLSAHFGACGLHKQSLAKGEKSRATYKICGKVMLFPFAFTNIASIRVLLLFSFWLTFNGVEFCCHSSVLLNNTLSFNMLWFPTLVSNSNTSCGFSCISNIWLHVGLLCIFLNAVVNKSNQF